MLRSDAIQKALDAQLASVETRQQNRTYVGKSNPQVSDKVGNTMLGEAGELKLQKFMD